ncbi:insulinase family protein [Mucilaginibacter limnophilus]|uniref:Insulinase family protein n=1 Tax=Mucilaginibacter limnophilus TaxID=1932778 RepID=A0A437MYP9_9SPHI|nr:pitrilysin family protein [Mucilaginibacter limnophilus]RVU02784.1 insulinase family protein [Mucilaginibacter limnophilus]
MTIDRTIAPEFKAINDIKLIKPEQLTLNNGLQVFCFNSGGQELLRLEWIFGNLRFNPEKPLLNQAVSTLITEGTETLTAAQIADRIDFYGAFLQAEYGFDTSQLTLFSLNKHLSSTLPVVKDVLTNAIFPQKEVDTYVRNQQQKLQVSLRKNDVVARRLFNKALHGNTLYGFSPEAEDYQKLQREDMLGHYHEMFRPSNCTLIISGKIEKEALDLIIEMFGENWQLDSNPADISQPEVVAATEHFYYKEKPGALQSAIRIGLPAVNRTHPDFSALQVLNTVLGGYFGSRLMANIREDKGYTYGIGSGISSFKHTGTWFIASEVGADVCRAAIAEVEKEIGLLKTELIPEDELNLVRNYMLGSLLGSLENVFSHADKFKNLYFSGLGYEYYDNYMQTVKTVTAEQLKDLANKYLDSDRFYKVIAGKY